MLASDLRWALDPVAFAVEALEFKPDAWQARFLRLTSKRVLLNCSRQSGKSSTAAVLALHTALYRPDSLILMVSPTLRQSGELFRKVTDQLNALGERPEMAEDNKLSAAFGNGSRIVSLPSNEAGIRGFSGAALIVEDEASRVPDALYRAVRPMLAVSGGRLILMSTPFGKRGHFHDEWLIGGPIWQRFEVKASDCPRITRAFLEEELRSLGEWWFRQEYACEFVDTVGTLFPLHQIQAAMDANIEPLITVPADATTSPLSLLSDDIRPLEAWRDQ